MAQMGRPKVEKPKNKQIAVRVDEKTYKEFNEYCERNGLSKSDLLLGFINTLLGNKK